MLIKHELLAQLENLNIIISKISESFSDEPSGRVIVKHISPDFNEYYFFNEGSDSHAEYISARDKTRIGKLLQKRYNHKVLQKAVEQRRLIESFLSKYDESAVQKVFGQFDRISQGFLDAYEYPEEQFVQKWLSEEYEPNPFPLASEDFVTPRGETVRSKSEVIISDCLSSASVPYKYECPLSVSKYQKIYPDFTVLNKRTREVYYWEHFGRMDSEEYRFKAFRKIDMYADLGLFPGKGLIVTFEDYKTPLNVLTVNRIIKRFLH